jgi:hypothetical protein
MFLNVDTETIFINTEYVRTCIARECCRLRRYKGVWAIVTLTTTAVRTPYPMCVTNPHIKFKILNPLVHRLSASDQKIYRERKEIQFGPEIYNSKCR